jgi:cytochrome c biogenesis protein CcmG/thiol:disulfide interchange protein DsbE
MSRMPIILVGAVCALLLAAPADAAKRRLGKEDKAALAVDRTLVDAMHKRDRGLLNEAIGQVQGVLRTSPDSLPAHLLYQEIAAVVRRNGGLVEAEYRHWLNEDPEDPRRMVLHAAATLTAALTTPGYLENPSRIKDIERSLAAAELGDGAASYAHLVYAEVEQVRQRFPEVQGRLEKALAADPLNLSARGDLILLLISQKASEPATAHCLELLDLAPWRAAQCKPLFPSRPGDERVGTQDEQERVLARVAGVEKEAKGDVVVLASLREFYDGVNETEASRIEGLLRATGSWTPPLRRNPYLAPLDGGEWDEAEIAAIERLLTIAEANPEAKVQVVALEAHQRELPDSPRVQAQFWRLLAAAKRDDSVGDRDGSRAALVKAREFQPDDPGLMNEWAYMSALDKVDLAEALAVSEMSIELLLGEGFDPIVIEPGNHYGDWSRSVGESAGAYYDTRGWLLYQLGRYEEAVSALQLASTLTIDGTVQGHLGRARYALGQDEGAFQHLLRALAMGTEEVEDVRKLASHIYSKTRVVPGGLDALVREVHHQILDELTTERPTRRPPERDEEAAAPDRRSEGSGFMVFGSDSDHPLVGKDAPNLVIDRIGAKGALELESLQGRVVVIDFWATWCGPCRKSLPMYEALSNAFVDEPVTFVMASVDDNLELIEEFWSDLDMPVEVGLVQDKGADAFGVKGIPAMFLVGKDGRVLGHHVGFEDGEGAQLAATLAVLATTPVGDDE